MTEVRVIETTSARIPTERGEFDLVLFEMDGDSKQHLAVVLGDVKDAEEVLVRVHSECFTGDVLGSQRCDCGEQFHLALNLISRAEVGALIYLRQEGRGIGLRDKLLAYNLQDQGFDTVDANLLLGHQPDERDYGIAAAILKKLGVRSIRLLTNNPHKIDELQELGIEVRARIALEGHVHPENESYLRAKATRLNHLLNLEASGNGNPAHAQKDHE